MSFQQYVEWRIVVGRTLHVRCANLLQNISLLTSQVNNPGFLHGNQRAVLFSVQLLSIRVSGFCKIILPKSQAPCTLQYFFFGKLR